MNPNGFQTTIYIDANNLPALVLNNAIAELSAIIITQYDYPDAEKKLCLKSKNRMICNQSRL